MIWYIEVLKKYAVFVGRARRKEFWFFFLFNIIIYGVLLYIDFGVREIEPESDQLMLSDLYGLAIVIPYVAVSVRRLHDTGRSGWWVWITLIPLIGLIIFYFFMAQDSQEGDNLDGPNPKKTTT